MDQRLQTLFILGASGDLTERYLLPSLGRLLQAQPDRRTKLIGSSRKDNPEWPELVADGFAGYSGPAVEFALSGTEWVTADATSADDWGQLLAQVEGQPVVYFALGAGVTKAACDALRDVDLPADTRLVLEKPFGEDADSAAELNELVTGLVGADQVFRVDHFLATPAVQSMRALRFANRTIDAVWNSEHVAELSVVWDEALDLAGRADFYDGTGALRDMIQSHLLHVLATAIMPPEADGGSAPLEVALASLSLAEGDGAARRARWTAGEIDGEPVAAYADHEGVDPDRRTETLAQLVLTSDLPQWQGVPLRLRSGKGLGEDRRLLEVAFRNAEPGAHGLREQPGSDRLRIDILTGAVEWALTSANPNDVAEAEPFPLRGSLYTPVVPGQPDHQASLDDVIEAADAEVYARVLQAVLDGDQSLSVTAANAVQCWRLVAPALAAFAADEVPLEEYPAGSQGADGWHEFPQPDAE